MSAVDSCQLSATSRRFWGIPMFDAVRLASLPDLDAVDKRIAELPVNCILGRTSGVPAASLVRQRARTY